MRPPNNLEKNGSDWYDEHILRVSTFHVPGYLSYYATITANTIPGEPAALAQARRAQVVVNDALR